MSEFEVAVPLPLDSDGFLRRECPTCEREFKWLQAQGDEDAAPAPEGGYYCPYCGIQADPGTWHTKAQVDLFERVVHQEVIAPMLEEFEQDLGQIEKSSGGLFKVTAHHDEVEPPEALSETDDMRRIDFVCHPGEPVKILEEWHELVRCMMCGQPESG